MKVRALSAVPFLLLFIVFPVLAAGCSSSATTTTTTTTTTSSPPGGLVVRSDSNNEVRIESITPAENGITELSVYLVSTQNIGALENPVAGKVGQTIDVWTDEDVSALKVGDTVSGHIQFAGDAIIGITYQLFDIGK